jgi:hypothetical protein
MNRSNSTLAVMLLGLLAIAICVRQTLEMSESVGSLTTAILIFSEGIAALALISIGFVLLIRVLSSSVRPVRFAAVRPLRRLVSSVWS